MNRKELDVFIEHHQLSAPNVDLALTLAGARPTPAETSRFALRALMLAGVLSLAAGVVFFVAANWDALRVVGRFALLEVVLLASLVLALVRPPPQTLGRSALLIAFVTTGALLALFGQTYQTGADVYELFLTWTVLGLPFVFAGQWSVLWAAWVFVLNVALGLFCGFQPEGGPLWFLLSGSGWATSGLLLMAALVNLALWALAELAHGRLPALLSAHEPPGWLRRFILTCALSFATWAGCLAILGHREIPLNVLGVLMILAGVAFYAVRRRSDVFPLALVAASIIALVTCLIGEIEPRFPSRSTGIPLFFAVWLIASSTVSGRVLMHLLRSWRT
jgi:uncharacterized membrane protein